MNSFGELQNISITQKVLWVNQFWGLKMLAVKPIEGKIRL